MHTDHRTDDEADGCVRFGPSVAFGCVSGRYNYQEFVIADLGAALMSDTTSALGVAGMADTLSHAGAARPEP